MESRNQQETVSVLLAGSADNAPVGSLAEMLALPEKVAAGEAAGRTQKTMASQQNAKKQQPLAGSLAPPTFKNLCPSSFIGG